MDANMISMIVTIVLIVVMMYFMAYKPQKKQQQQQKQLMESIEKGDYILTTSGFYGVVIDVTEEDVIVEFGSNKNCRISMQKSAIAKAEKPTQQS